MGEGSEEDGGFRGMAEKVKCQARGVLGTKSIIQRTGCRHRDSFYSSPISRTSSSCVNIL